MGQALGHATRVSYMPMHVWLCKLMKFWLEIVLLSIVLLGWVAILTSQWKIHITCHTPQLFTVVVKGIEVPFFYIYLSCALIVFLLLLKSPRIRVLLMAVRFVSIVRLFHLFLLMIASSLELMGESGLVWTVKQILFDYEATSSQAINF